MLGPIVGHVTKSTARLWLQGEDVDALAYRAGGGAWQSAPAAARHDRHHTTVVDLVGLLPGTEYEFVFRRQGSDVDGARGRFATFAAQIDQLSFLIGSCHKATTKSPPADWERLSALASEVASNDLLILCGDQIYEQDIAGKAALNRKELEAERVRHYQESWGDRKFREVTAYIPTYMTWDDHEIRDDWGSGPDDWKRAFELRLFESAEATYQAFQNAHNPPGLGGKRHFGFEVGPIGFYFLDARGARGQDAQYPILGKDQFRDFMSWTESVAGRIELFFLVSSVPLAHASVHAVGAAQTMGLDLAIDTADAWSSERNLPDLVRVLDTLFHLQTEGLVRRAFVLSGDVHVATATEIHSPHPQHARSPVIHQFTSSPLSNTAPSWIAAVGSGLFIRGEVALGAGYQSYNKRFVARRNFGRVVTSRALNGKWKVEFRLYAQGQGVFSHMGTVEC